MNILALNLIDPSLLNPQLKRISTSVQNASKIARILQHIRRHSICPSQCSNHSSPSSPLCSNLLLHIRASLCSLHIICSMLTLTHVICYFFPNARAVCKRKHLRALKTLLNPQVLLCSDLLLHILASLYFLKICSTLTLTHFIYGLFVNFTSRLCKESSEGIKDGIKPYSISNWLLG